MRGQVRTTAAWPGPGNGRGNPWAVRLNSGDCCRGCCSWPCTRPSSRQACRRAGWLSTSEAEEAAQKEVKEQQTSHTMVPSPSSSCQVQTNPTGSADDLLARPDIKAGKRSLAHSDSPRWPRWPSPRAGPILTRSMTGCGRWAARWRPPTGRWSSPATGNARRCCATTGCVRLPSGCSPPRATRTGSTGRRCG